MAFFQKLKWLQTRGNTNVYHAQSLGRNIKKKKKKNRFFLITGGKQIKLK